MSRNAAVGSLWSGSGGAGGSPCVAGGRAAALAVHRLSTASDLTDNPNLTNNPTRWLDWRGALHRGDRAHGLLVKFTQAPEAARKLSAQGALP